MNLSNKTFCVLPFISSFKSLDGKDTLCCYSNTAVNLANNEMIEIKNKILNGVKIPNCEPCYFREEQNFISPRIRESNHYLQDQEISNYIKNWTAETETKYFYFDLEFSNKCNLACIMCNEKQSSLWAQELKIEQKLVHQSFDIKKYLGVKKIYLAGGEPLIIDEALELLYEVGKLNIQPEIVINTNLTRVNDDIKSILSKIKRLSLTVSVDAYGKVNEYHRYPIKWDKFLTNLENVSDLGCSILYNTVVDAISIFGIGDLVEIEKFAASWNIVSLNRPAALKIKNIPTHFKTLALDKFEKVKTSKFYGKDNTFTQNVNNITKVLFENGDEIQLQNFIKEIDNRRQINHSDYIGLSLY